MVARGGKINQSKYFEMLFCFFPVNYLTFLKICLAYTLREPVQE